ncbi:MAG: threonylcarbamoyladenosine tRNA methylthiotransferase MtaB [Pirellulaceae bacterium]|jgi:threonylcarbamoyladenosine tRNA methylthiotransferase MtaB
MPGTKIALLKTVTLGCKVNQYETEYIREGLISIGYEDAGDDTPADLCIVNTCTVTNEGDSKSRQIIRRLNRDNPDARIVVMGCYATRAPEEVAELPGVAEVVTDKRELPDLLGRFGVIDIPTGISQFGNRSRAYVKIQDGCLLRCSYCIIPKVRPKLTSRPLQHILDEVQRLLANGYKEIVLTGIHLGHYGVDWNWDKPKEEWVRLSNLVRELVQFPGDYRLRLSSIEATEVTRELISVMQEYSAKICPHLHICLQSGSDSVLRRMKRRWGTRLFLDRCQLVREALDNPAITTDVIVGFPGETEEEFAQTLETVEAAGFSKVHMFPFSPRRGTPAAEMENMVTKQVKSRRGKELAALEERIRDEYFGSLIGSPLRVLVEAESRENDGFVAGTSCRYAPVEFPGDASQIGQLVDVVPKRLVDGRLYCD